MLSSGGGGGGRNTSNFLCCDDEVLARRTREISDLFIKKGVVSVGMACDLSGKNPMAVMREDGAMLKDVLRVFSTGTGPSLSSQRLCASLG